MRHTLSMPPPGACEAMMRIVFEGYGACWAAARGARHARINATVPLRLDLYPLRITINLSQISAVSSSSKPASQSWCLSTSTISALALCGFTMSMCPAPSMLVVSLSQPAALVDDTTLSLSPYTVLTRQRRGLTFLSQPAHLV